MSYSEDSVNKQTKCNFFVRVSNNNKRVDSSMTTERVLYIVYVLCAPDNRIKNCRVSKNVLVLNDSGSPPTFCRRSFFKMITPHRPKRVFETQNTVDA